MAGTLSVGKSSNWMRQLGHCFWAERQNSSTASMCSSPSSRGSLQPCASVPYQQLIQSASRIRNIKIPSVYKGKGIRVIDIK